MFDGKCSAELIQHFCDYIGLTITEFWVIVNQYVNPALFERLGEGKYKPKFKVGVGI